MFKVQNKSSPAIMSRVFPITEKSYILTSDSNFVSRRINTVHCECESLSRLGIKLGKILPNEYKQLGSLKEFKSNIKTWVSNNYLFCLCKKICATCWIYLTSINEWVAVKVDID